MALDVAIDRLFSERKTRRVDEVEIAHVPMLNLDPETVHAVEQWADQLGGATSMALEALLERVLQVVTPFGIDPSRFGY